MKLLPQMQLPIGSVTAHQMSAVNSRLGSFQVGFGQVWNLWTTIGKLSNSTVALSFFSESTVAVVRVLLL
jgi:hypothetical protein